MYFPYLSKRAPSNRECRIASFVSVMGFAGFAWLALAMPGALDQMLLWLVAVELTLAYFGLGTLYIAKPNHFLLRPRQETRVLRGQPVPRLDERDLNFRYRTFLVSYRVLSVAAFAIIVFVRPAASLLVSSSGGHIPHWRLEAAEQVFVVLLFLLSLFLPYWVFPWLESDAPFDDEQGSDSGFQNPMESLSRWRDWIRSAIYLLAIWAPIFLLLAWLYRRYTHLD
jgi:hypothetical protein